MRPRSAAILVMSLLVLAGACGGTRIIRGALVVFDIGAEMGDWDDCAGEGEYADMAPGASVSFGDVDGRELGSGVLRSFTEQDSDLLAVNDEGDVAEAIFDDLVRGEGVVCALAFEVEVNDADDYVIELAGRRGGLTYSREDLEEDGYRVALQLGRGSLR